MTVHCGSVSDSGCERRDQKRLKAARRNTEKVAQISDICDL